MFNKLLGKQITDVLGSAGNILDKVVTNKKESQQVKNELAETITPILLKAAELQTEIISNDQKGNFLQRSWRPIMMLVFVFMLLAYWFGFASPPEIMAVEVLSIIKIGSGAYIVSRGVEKVSKDLSTGTLLSQLKRKDRADYGN